MAADLGVTLQYTKPTAENGTVLSKQSAQSGAGSAQTTIKSPAERKASLYWVITAFTGNAWLKFGTNPTAAAGADHFITAGQTRKFKAGAGEVMAYING